MTNTRHRNADVIIAFAEGRKIQARYIDPVAGPEGDWDDATDLAGIESNQLEWRIKPEKVKGWVAISADGWVTGVAESREQALTDHAIIHDTAPAACIEIEYEPGEGL